MNLNRDISITWLGHAAFRLQTPGGKMIIPMHYATFPVLTGTPQALRQETAATKGPQILELKPGETLK